MGPETADGQAAAERAAGLAERVAALEAQVAELQRVAAAASSPPRLRSFPGLGSSGGAPLHAPALLPAGRADAATGRSLESDIGSKVLSKVAVLLLLAGAAWFLKWAFDNRWIGASGRVLIGLAAGAGDHRVVRAFSPHGHTGVCVCAEGRGDGRAVSEFVGELPAPTTWSRRGSRWRR